jgi:hypothetical protein
MRLRLYKVFMQNDIIYYMYDVSYNNLIEYFKKSIRLGIIDKPIKIITIE